MRMLLLISLLFSSFVCASTDTINLRCSKAFQQYVIAEQQQASMSYDAMVTIFSSLTLDYKKLLSAIRKDILMCKRYIRQHLHDSIEHNALLQELRKFFNYVRKHKHCCSALLFHHDLKQRYAPAFNNLNIVRCVEDTPVLYGVAHDSKHKSKVYFNQILIDLSRISKFEDYLHGDYSILKAHNYVFKIELIKLRNSIYHNNVYKYQTSYF